MGSPFRVELGLWLGVLCVLLEGVGSERAAWSFPWVAVLDQTRLQPCAEQHFLSRAKRGVCHQQRPQSAGGGTPERQKGSADQGAARPQPHVLWVSGHLRRRGPVLPVTENTKSGHQPNWSHWTVGCLAGAPQHQLALGAGRAPIRHCGKVLLGSVGEGQGRKGPFQSTFHRGQS